MAKQNKKHHKPNKPVKAELQKKLLKPWERTCRIEDITPIQVIEPTAWFRLIPVMGLGAAKLRIEHPQYNRCQGCRFPEPKAPLITIDRKLAPLIDLVDEGFGTQVLCSERFVDALESAGATGWKATLLEHATSNPVSGRKFYQLTAQGVVGQLVNTKVEPQEQKLCPKCGRPFFVAPLPPVSFDATSSSGHDVCWSSQWFGGASSPWRALLVRGTILAAIMDKLPGPPTFQAEKVFLTGKEPVQKGEPGQRIERKEPTYCASQLNEVLSSLERLSTKYKHSFLPGAKKSAIHDEFKKLSFSPPAELEKLLLHWNGAKLFNGALNLASVGTKDSILQLNKAAAKLGYPVSEGWVAFADSTYGYIFWTVNSKGLVRGTGRDGIVYGPDAPFSTWLADQVADLTYAWDHQQELPWAELVLHG